MIDISKIKPGDKVTLVPLVFRGLDENLVLVFDACGWPCKFDPDQIAAHHPAPREIKVGRRVRDKRHPTWTGLVRGLDRDDAWVRWDFNWPLKTEWPLSDLTLVEGDQ